MLPDSIRYQAMGEGKAVPYPFMYRWLPVFLAKGWGWKSHRNSILLVLAIYTALYVQDIVRGIAAVLLLVGLSGVWRFNRNHPVLVDATAMVCALISAVVVQHDNLFIAVLFGLAAGASKETAPIFAALWAWNPLPLVGLIAPFVRRIWWKAGSDPLGGEAHEAITHPIRTAWEVHKRTSSSVGVWIAPWGACILALALSGNMIQLIATLVVAYAQCIVATDTARLYMWAWPVMVLGTVSSVPLMWLPVIVAAHWIIVSIIDYGGL